MRSTRERTSAAGGDLRAGDAVVAAGAGLGAAQVGALAAAGVAGSRARAARGSSWS